MICKDCQAGHHEHICPDCNMMTWVTIGPGCDCGIRWVGESDPRTLAESYPCHDDSSKCINKFDCGNCNPFEA